MILGKEAFENIVGKGENAGNRHFLLFPLFLQPCPGDSVVSMLRLVTWWLLVQDPVEAKFLSGVFSSLTSAEACEKTSWWLWNEINVSTGVRNPGNTCASPTAMI